MKVTISIPESMVEAACEADVSVESVCEWIVKEICDDRGELKNICGIVKNILTSDTAGVNTSSSHGRFTS